MNIHNKNTASSPSLTEFLSDACIVFFGLWSFSEHIAYFSGFTFRGQWLLGCLFASVGIISLWLSQARFTVSRTASQNVEWTPWIAAVIAVGLSVFLNRPSRDDEHYLNLAVLALDNTDMPMHSIEVLFSGYALTSYEYFRAAFASLFGVPLLSSYYVIWPAAIAALVVIFQWRLLNELSVQHKILAIILFFVVMLAWGDKYRTPPNFGFIRLYQGKGALIWLVIPSAIYYWLQLVKLHEEKYLGLLFCSIVAGIGFSPTGVLMGVLLVCLFILATFLNVGWQESKKTILKLMIVCAYPIVIGLVMHFYFGHSSPGVHTEQGIRDSVYTHEQIIHVLGGGMRALIAVVCAVLLPFTLRESKVKSLLSTFSLCCSFLLIFPWTSLWLGKYGFMTFSWRWLYVIPFVLAILVAVDKLISLASNQFGRIVVAMLAGVIFISVSPRWVISKSNKTEFSTLGYKIVNNKIHLRLYDRDAKIDGAWLISPVTGEKL